MVKVKVQRDGIDRPYFVEELLQDGLYAEVAEFPQGELEMVVEADHEEKGWFELRIVAVDAYYKRVLGNSVREESPTPPFMEIFPVEE